MFESKINDNDFEAYKLSQKIKGSGFESIFEFVLESHLPVLNLFHTLLIFSKPMIAPIVNPSSIDVIERLLIDSDFRDRVMSFVEHDPKDLA